jgi:hypothetical protein
MCVPSGRLTIVLGSVGCLLAIACSDASAQRSRLLEFGPDAAEVQPRAGKDRRMQPVPAAIEPRAGRWHPWVLTSGQALRLPPPPDERSTAVELRELKRLMAGDDAEKLERIRYWDFGSSAHRWHEMLTDMGVRDDVGSTAGIRAFPLLNVAIHDALVAAWDSKYTYNRRRPSEDSGLLAPEVSIPRSPSYPCEHAVTAGAAAAVLAHLFPADAQRFAGAAHEAAWSRVMAGAVYPSDARAGLDLGRAVAAHVLEYAKTHDAAGWAGLAHVFLREGSRSTLESGDLGVWAGAHFQGDVEASWEIGRRVGAAMMERARGDGAE